MKTKLLTAILLIASLSSKSQVTAFQKLFPEAGVNQIVDASPTFDGGYIVCGNYNYKDSAGTMEYRPIVIKMDASGNKVWEKHPSINFCPSMVRPAVDGGYMLFGKIAKTGRLFYGIGGLLKLNSNGDTLLSKVFPKIRVANSGFSSEAITASADSGFVATGSIINEYNVYVLKTNGKGDTIWSNKISGTGRVSGFSISRTNDGGFIIIGSDSANMLLTRIGANGASLWMKSIYDGKGNQNAGFSVKQTSDGGFIAFGKSSAGANAWCLAKTNATGDTAWTITNNDPNYMVENGKVWQTSDGGFILMGDNTVNPLLIKLNSNGTILWKKVLNAGNGSTQIIHSGILMSDGGYLLAGTSIDNNSGTAAIYVVKTDASGCITNTINGTVFLDGNRNKVQDAGENGLAQRLVLLNPGSVYATTDNLGNYSFNVPAGSYTISLPSVNYYSLEAPMANYTVSFPALGDSAKNLNFADTLLSSCPDLTVSATTCGLRPCFKNSYFVSYSNLGTIADTNAVITLQADTQIVFQNSSIPWTSSGRGIYSFNIGTVLPGQTGTLTVVDSVSCALALNINECLTATISSTMTECDNTNNSATDCHLTNGSFDPNAKKVASQNFKTKGYLTQETIMPDDTLTYLITFQNTGTAPAFNIVVKDTLSKFLDFSTIHTDAASASYTYSVSPQGVVTFTFANVMLADSGSNEAASHGFIRFTIRQKQGNTGGEIIQSRASIVFDYNKPVLTNATVNPIMLITGITTPKGSAGTSRVFPNPFQGTATLEISAGNISSGSLTQCFIYDMIGQQVASFPIGAGISSDPGQPSNLTQTFDLSNLPKGMYFYTVTNNNKALSTGKMIID
ncbi:MAG TPA: T9SS type A sorting domain-containing protein [Bacteroidia bacterium]|nr:T9SS type A sorting domain-containing protein [Bacteroidia bacterium]